MAVRPQSLLGILGLTALTAGAAAGQPADPAIPGQVTVRVVDAQHLNQCVAALAKQYAPVVVLDTIPGRDIHLLSYALGPGQDTAAVEQALANLQADGTLVWGELNYGAQTAEGKTDSLWVSQLTIGADEYAQQYSWNLLQLTAAHLRTTGFGTTIAVLDTGVDAQHPLLAGRVLATGLSLVGSLSPTVEIADGVDTDGDGNVAEMLGHGTFMAGLIAGVAPDAKLLSVRVLDDDGYGDLFKITKGMYWAIDQGVDVINMSLGSTYHGHGSSDAARDASLAGIAVVGAAGNLNVEDPREYPACDSKSVGVAATTWLDIKAPFSNFNARLALSAPGATLFGAGGVADPAKSIISCVPGGGFASWEGTSASTALVSGTIALVRAQHPEWPNRAVPLDAIVDEVILTLSVSAAPIDQENPGYEGLLGAGRIDAGAAAALGPIQPTPGDLTLDGSVNSADLAILLGAWGPCSGCIADIDGSGQVDANDLAILLGHWG